MLTKLRILSLAILLIVNRSHTAEAFLARADVTVSLEIIANRVDGSSLAHCETSEIIQAYSKREWWIALGETKPHPATEPEGFGYGIHCGSDPLEEPNQDLANASGNSVLIVGISTVARIIRKMEDEKLLSMKVSLAIRKRSGLALEDPPVFQQSQLDREFVFSGSQDAFVPLLVATEAEREALGLYEVFLRIRVSTVEENSRALYGAITVTSGFGEAELLLDGGTTGRIAAAQEETLRNVRVGMREVGVRDATGREVRKAVEVSANRTVLVDLSPPDSAGQKLRYRLTSLENNSQGYEEYRREADGAVVVKIPAGEFLMGNKETERAPLEHHVYVSEFLMDKTGVTWGQFKKFAEATGIPLPPHEPYWGIHDDHPMVYVTWEEAKAYCEWAGGRLPTEAEREKGARGTDGRKYPWGNEEPDPSRAVFRRTWGHEATAAVGTHPAGASTYGLLDMGGNVWEWCADWYDDEYYETSPYRDPKGPPIGRAHVVRGGSWDSRPSVLSASCRSWGHPGYRDGDFGFRCAMNVPR